MSAAGTRDERLAGPGRLIVLSGPSGVGKDTVLQALFEQDPSLRYSVSYTTRPPRPDEQDGRAYSFVDDNTFDDMIARGEFLEWADIYSHRYGTARARVQDAVRRGDDIVLKIDVQGAESVRRQVDGDATFIFLLPPSEDELKRRLMERATEDADGVQLRWQTALHELGEQDKYDHRVVNDDVQRAAREIRDIIQQDRKARRASVTR